MTSINSAVLSSGRVVQQKYGASGISRGRTDRAQTRTTVTPFGDTVEISSEAWALFHAQSAENTTSTRPSAADSNHMTGAENTPVEAAGTFGKSFSVEDQISQLETEKSGLESEIAALEEDAGTDEIAEAVLRSKLARLQILQAKLTGLLAKSFQMA
jgi:hypothetical protein